MKKYRFLAMAVVASLGLASCSQRVEQTASYSIIPQPNEVVLNPSAEPFHLTGSTVISYQAGNAELEKNAHLLKDYIKQLTDLDLKITEELPESDAIVLHSDQGGSNPEGYVMVVGGNFIGISGNTPAGTFYGIQTLRKSIPEAVKSTVVFPAAVITDEPRFAYRGAHFDVSRHFFPADSVKSFIDMLALHNINKLHWHLTDDQGWRVEIKSRPLLTELGSKRGGTVIGHNSGEYDNVPVEGYYTQEEIKDIIQYAADRYITIIPEIDLPGHMLGALKGYPELGCTGGPYEVWQQWGVSEDVLCAGNDSTYAFIEDVLGEIADLFPSEFVHVGGDECPKARWEECEVCQAKIAQLGFKNDEHGTKEEKLQSHVIHYASDFLAGKGKKMIGWDEILEGGLAPGAVVMSWRGEGGGIEAAKQGHDVIMTPNTYLYFDYYQTLDKDNEPDAIGGYIPLERVYSYEPMPRSLTEEEAAHIIGVQANLWTEYMPTYAQVQYMELPRMAALSEVQWSNAPKNYEEFVHRVPQIIEQYKANGYNYATHVFNVEGKLSTDTVNHTVNLEFSTVDDAPIHYTLDGTEPTSESPIYTEPLHLDKTAVIKAVVLRKDGPSRLFTDSISFNKATSRKITLENEPAHNFRAQGAQTLVDGRFGVGGFNTGGWVGFYGKDAVAVIDLDEPTSVSEVTTRTCVDTGSWIFDANAMKVAVSDNGTTWKEVAAENYPTLTAHKSEIVTHSLSFEPVEARFVKVTVGVEKAIPDWHGGKGAPSYVFLDEIEID